MVDTPAVPPENSAQAGARIAEALGGVLGAPPGGQVDVTAFYDQIFQAGGILGHPTEADPFLYDDYTHEQTYCPAPPTPVTLEEVRAGIRSVLVEILAESPSRVSWWRRFFRRNP